jgi:eukaryotic-like serine/threonine-protein kinase
MVSRTPPAPKTSGFPEETRVLPKDEAADSQARLTAGPASGGLLKRYRPIAKLARGGMADIFLAVSENAVGSARTVVLKRLRPDVREGSEERFTAMFRDEARLATQFNHPNVVHTYEVEDDGDLFIVMEYAEGHTLGEIQRSIRKGSTQALSQAQFARIMVEVLAGLHYAHELSDFRGEPLRIVHRDVSPQNIMVGYDGRVRLLDFGIAKASLQTTETEVGMLKGKVRYMAPEQVDPNATVDRRADIFAIGVVLWEMVTKQRLFSNDMSVASLVALVNPAIPAARASSVFPDIHPMLDSILAKALEKVPANRFQTAAEMKRALEEYLMAAGEMVSLEDVGAIIASGFADVRERLALQVKTAIAEAQSSDGYGQSKLDALTELGVGASKSHVSAVGATNPGSGSFSGPGVAPQSQSSDAQVRSGVIENSPNSLGEGNLGAYARQEPSSGPRGSRRGLWLGVALVLGLCVVALAVYQFTTAKVATVTTANGATDEQRSKERLGVSSSGLSLSVSPSTAPSGGADVASNDSSENKPLKVATTSRTNGTPIAYPSAVAGGAAAAKNAAVAQPAPAPTPAKPEPVVSSSAPAAIASSEKGVLTVDTYPWTKVSIDGRSVGNTPLVGLALPVGVHTITMENAEEKVSKTVQVTIEPNKTTTRRFSFEK